VVGGNVRYLASSRWRAHLWSLGDALTVR
jgi:hypothetical protein